MAGVPGRGGPIPKRDAERRRRNKPDVPTTTVTPTGAALSVKVPRPSTSWHPIARDWYKSLAESGQAQFMEPSDWQAARYVAEAVSQNLMAERFSAQLFASVWSAMNDLLTTEGARRRVRIEIEREQAPTGPSAEVVAMAAYRDALGG